MTDVWCDITESDAASQSTIATALGHTPTDYLLATARDLPGLASLHPGGRLKLAAVAADAEQIRAAAALADVIVTRDRSLLGAVRASGRTSALWDTVTDGPTLQGCRDAIGECDFLIVSFSDETNIPLELLIAAAQNTPTKVVKRVADGADAIVSSGVLESGPHGVLFPVRSVAEAAAVTDVVLRRQVSKLDLVEAVVTSVRHAGMGYRGCVDTTWLLREDEGMIVGSTSSGGFLVCAEVHYLPYMNLRPFRVNAGAVHSYVWANGVTEYITDLRAGSTVLAVNTRGEARPVTVGRVKTELRPLRLIEATAGPVTLGIFLQDDWHVRLFGADGQPRNCSTVRVGDRLLTYVCDPGRHVGIKVSESIREA
jgi:3-dehydroquinate synthase II/3-amino-4-hydroxybenzoic acid synthase